MAYIYIAKFFICKPGP